MTNVTYKCFIASAFGFEDVDSVFDKCIKPVLKRLSIKPLRVDRVEHNEDIDNKIFELIHSSDLCIADLTYARPSVYYEAGYAFGLGKPVVYICRSDHFKARENDLVGNLRVHFDLQMKNIIRWETSNITFSERLEKRLRNILRPIARVHRVDELLHLERMAFSRLSQIDQRVHIAIKAKFILRSRGYRSHRDSKNQVNYPWRFFMVARTTSQLLQVIIFLSLPTITKNELRNFISLGLLPFTTGTFNGTVQGHYVIASLRSIPRSRISDELSSFNIEGDNSFSTTLYSRNYESSRHLFFHFIDNIKSEGEFANRLRNIIPLIYKIDGVE